MVDRATTMVSIANTRIGSKEIPDTARVNASMLTDPELVDSRFVTFLDAFASLAVWADKGQVVAAALQIDEGNAILTLAENGEVKPAVKTHVLKLWQLLKELSTLTDAVAVQNKKREIVKKSYGYSIAKIKSRFVKHLWLKAFEKTFATGIARLAGSDDQKGRGLEIISTLVSVQDMLPTITTTSDARWDELMAAMDNWRDDVKVTLPRTAEWAESLAGGGKRARLYVAIKKLTSHHRFILHLIAYSRTPLGSRDLTLRLQVLGNPKDPAGGMPAGLLPIPGCTALITPFMPPRVTAASEIQKVTSKLGLTAQRATYLGTVHCECTLIANLGGPGMKKNWPVRYIGVSKLSCSACYSWIQAYNNQHQHQQRFFTAGTHGKWYAQWTIPAASAYRTEGMFTEMIAVVGGAYRTYLTNEAAFRDIMVADSTDAKGVVSGPTVTVAMMQVKKLWTTRERNQRHTPTNP